MKTYMATPATIERKWYVVDAADKTLGRLAAEVAKVLRGKNKPTFTPHMDTGDHVIIINAAQVKLTGKKTGAEGLLPSLRVSGRRQIHQSRGYAEKQPCKNGGTGCQGYGSP